MALKLYRRHRKECEAGHVEDLRTGQFEESRRGWKRCGCVIHVCGTLSGKFSRRQTGAYDWDEAQRIAGEWEAAGVWDGLIAPPPPPASATVIERVTVAESIKAFLENKETANVKRHTVDKYRTMTNQLAAFARAKGIVYIDSFTITDCDGFYNSWKDGFRTRAKKLDRLKSFVKFCLKRKWLSENVAEDLKAPEGSSIPKQKTPFTDADIAKLIAACDKVKRTPRCDWDGEDLKDFLFFAIHTGLRISDITLFDIDKRMDGNNIVLRAMKNGSTVCTWIPDWLVLRLKARKQAHGSLIFRAGTALNAKQMTQIWRDRRLREVFRYATPLSVKPTPHLCRHTFVRILLERGVSIQDVAQLIGDTPEVVAKHYSAWIPSRQARLTNILKDAFADRPALTA